MAYLVALYRLDRACFSSAEGGAWYDCGELVRVIRTCSTRDRAHRTANRVNAWLERLQKHQRSISSVLYDGSRYGAQVEHHIPRPHFPAEVPTYE